MGRASMLGYSIPLFAQLVLEVLDCCTTELVNYSVLFQEQTPPAKPLTSVLPQLLEPLACCYVHKETDWSARHSYLSYPGEGQPAYPYAFQVVGRLLLEEHIFGYRVKLLVMPAPLIRHIVYPPLLLPPECYLLYLILSYPALDDRFNVVLEEP